MANNEMLRDEVKDGFLTGYAILEMPTPARLRIELDRWGNCVGYKLMEPGHGSFSRISNGSWEFMGERFMCLVDAVNAARARRKSSMMGK